MSSLLNAKLPYATESELQYLRSLSVETVVMLGAGPGVMALAVLEGSPDAKITVIDRDTVKYVFAHIHEANLLRDNVLGIVCDSADAAQYIPDGSVDLLIVDADHSYEAVGKDLKAWTPKVKIGGLIFCHDYDASGTEFAGKEQYPGVKLAVQQVAKGTEYRVGTSAVLCRAQDGLYFASVLLK